jgi:acyl-CoA thioesterase-2
VPDLWIDLLGCLDLHSGTDDLFDGQGVTTFDGASQQLQYHRVFGGQLLGQFVRAAQLTSPDKTVISVHAPNRSSHESFARIIFSLPKNDS